jgi:hypothetical protein|tara:strand:- start:523 stop:924 length:402 start_codon:yes stop_codon:yes gene_type:complete
MKETVVSVAKCPLCEGKILKKDVSIRLKSLRLSRSPSTLVEIDAIISELSKHWTIDDIHVAGFLADISNIDDMIVLDSIRKFKKKNGIEQGFNIKYLAGIIKNENKRYRLRQDYERRSLDRIPPKLKDEDEEY